jgi:alpha-ketoglutarate-dependent taurine dioxygenase
MIKEQIQKWTLEPLVPFGLKVEAERPGDDLRLIPFNQLKKWVAKHRVLVLRGFASLPDKALPEFCRNLGEILKWEFGAVNELKVKNDSPNYLYTNREVPFHWDGAFKGEIPHYIFFECDTPPPPGSGGETLFCDTTRLLRNAPPAKTKLWQEIEITYTTEKIVHYGGSFSSPVLSWHPLSGEEIIRYAEPVADLNPVSLEIKGIPQELREEFLQDMHRRLNDEKSCYGHKWQSGDIVIADNFALLHGRRAFSQNAKRLIRRVNIL